MRLMDFVDGMRELPSAPVLLTMDLSLGAFDHASVALEHRGDLFALVRMDQKHDFVVSHYRLPSD